MTYPGFAPPAPPQPQYQPQQYQQPYPQMPPQQYQQPQFVQMPPGYPQPTYAPPAPALAQGSIDDFYNQPSTGGGKALTFNQPGETYIGIVARAVNSGDIQQQTNTQNVPQTFKDGRPKFVMKVPLQMQPTPAFPDGLAQWYVKGAARDELVRAMAEVGAPQGPPEAGAIIQVTFTGTRQSGPGMNPAKLFAVQYRRPDGSAPVPAAPAPVVPAPGYSTPPQQLPPYATESVQQYGQLQQQQAPQYGPPVQAPLPPQYTAPAQAPVQMQAPVQQPAPQVPQGVQLPPMDAAQQELLAKLTGATQPAG